MVHPRARTPSLPFKILHFRSEPTLGPGLVSRLAFDNIAPRSRERSKRPDKKADRFGLLSASVIVVVNYMAITWIEIGSCAPVLWTCLHERSYPMFEDAPAARCQTPGGHANLSRAAGPVPNGKVRYRTRLAQSTYPRCRFKQQTLHRCHFKISSGFI
jgi:hypothetical protein